MLYAILAYHVEAEVMSWTPEQDAADDQSSSIDDRLNEKKLLGPAARLGATADARTLRGRGRDGARRAVCRNQRAVAGAYVVDCADEAAASGWPETFARSIRPRCTRSAPSALYPRRALAGERVNTLTAEASR